MDKECFTIRLDNKTIKTQVNLLFIFDDLDKFACKGQSIPAKSKTDVVQHVPNNWESTIISKDDGPIVHPPTLITMDPVHTNTLLVTYEDGQVDFQGGTEQKKTLSSNQISAENVSNQAPSGAVGLVPTGYSDQLKPDLTLRIASDGVTGQTFDTNTKSTQPVHFWNLYDPTNTPDNFHWVVYSDERSNYQIRPDHM